MESTVRKELQPAALIECPRDAMQGWPHFIPTEIKIAYLNLLMQAGFDTLDFGSFVSPKAISQLADTKTVAAAINRKNSGTRLLAIVANLRGAREACEFEQIDFLGFPFSLSPVFQLRNTNSTLEESLERVKEIQKLCHEHHKQLVVYLSMGFGNPYGDPYNAEILAYWAAQMVDLGISIISLADTVGLATPGQISFALQTLIPTYPGVTFGVHLHSTATNRTRKLEAAYSAGCRRFDGALKGIGGCPMAMDALVGNMSTEFIIDFLEQKKLPTGLDKTILSACLEMTEKIFQ